MYIARDSTYTRRHIVGHTHLTSACLWGWGIRRQEQMLPSGFGFRRTYMGATQRLNLGRAFGVGLDHTATRTSLCTLCTAIWGGGKELQWGQRGPHPVCFVSSSLGTMFRRPWEGSIIWLILAGIQGDAASEFHS